MGFFNKLFGKQRGGSIVGNLIRGVASSATGGILGSGAALSARNNREDDKKFDSAVAAQVAETLAKQPSFQAGKKIGVPISAQVNKITDSPEAKKIKQNIMLDYLKDNWIKIVGGLIGIVLLIFVVRYFLKKGVRGSFKI